MATANARRLRVRDKYRTILGRNYYSQPRRNYCYKQYRDGKYYSDCSSSVSWTYSVVGESFGILNTVGMWTSSKLVDVPVKIVKGIIQNPDVLCIGDMLLFAGNDAGRKTYGYVGHVEMVGEISSGGKVTLYGHGSGRPKKHEMNAYCRSRYKQKASTPLGHRGLIRVRRFITDQNSHPGQTDRKLGERTLRRGDVGPDVKELQIALMRLGYALPKYGAAGDFGGETELAVNEFQRMEDLSSDGVFSKTTYDALMGSLYGKVKITGASVNVRSGPGTGFAVVGIVHNGDILKYMGVRSESGWCSVDYKGMTAWVSGKYAEFCS